MNEAILAMLKRYQCVSQQDYKNALKEILQELVLLGLWRAKFFEKAAFYGGTALRILYGLDRFSEDLDFSLLKINPSFSLEVYEKAIETELKSFGFVVSVQSVQKSTDSAIQSAFLKANTLEHFLRIEVPHSERKKCHVEESIKIKLECDTEPPLNFATEARFLLQPIPFSVLTYSQPDLFAGKLHALLYRSWKTRVKGRDWYDFIWFISRQIPVNLEHLAERMKQTGHLALHEKLTREDLIDKMRTKIAQLDIEQAKKDILPFIKDSHKITVWSPEFFYALTDQIKAYSTVTQNERLFS
jgi:predicted nucleotidyltransferase component of viral defense system